MLGAGKWGVLGEDAGVQITLGNRYTIQEHRGCVADGDGREGGARAFKGFPGLGLDTRVSEASGGHRRSPGHRSWTWYELRKAWPNESTLLTWSALG